MRDYSIYYKEKMPIEEDWEEDSWDFFISAYTTDERTRTVYDKVNATNKIWVILPEYNLPELYYPNENKFIASGVIDEASLISELFEYLGGIDKTKKYCIDVTGFLGPYLMMLIKWIQLNEITVFDVLYAEPHQYKSRELTNFSDEAVIGVRQVLGFEGSHCADTSRDLLIINSGYDHELVANAAEHKDNACKIQMFGFPPLRADMYQENIVRAHYAQESVGSLSADEAACLLAPANDPFVTANVLSEYYQTVSSRGVGLTNLYLCPLGTKPQLVGFTLFYLSELIGTASSIIYPFCRSYEFLTSRGVSSIWKYTLEF